eukprot:4713546-Pyramimonas_sp.AAC.1
MSEDHRNDWATTRRHAYVGLMRRDVLRLAPCCRCTSTTSTAPCKARPLRGAAAASAPNSSATS